MHEIPKHCAAVLSRAIFIGFCIQIALGILWMCNAFAGWNSFGEGIVCVGQIAGAGIALFWMWLEIIGEEKRRSICERRDIGGYMTGIFSVLCVLTFPMVLQCLMQPDVRVAAAALFLIQVACCIRAVKEGDADLLEDRGQGRKIPSCFVAALFFWLTAGLVRQEYLFLGLAPAVICLLRLWKNRQGQGFHLMLLTMAAAGLISGIGSFYQKPIELLPHMLSRVSWTTIYESYTGLPKEQRRLLNYFKIEESSYEVNGIEEVLMPYLEKKEDQQEVRAALKNLMAVSWRENKKKILKECAWDMAGYMAAPVIVPLQLQGRAYESCSGFNYRQLLQPAPRLGKWYMDYGCWWFVVALVLRGILWLSAERRLEEIGLTLTGISGIFMAFWYTMDGAGKMDYKNTLFILWVWLGWIASAGGGHYEEA